MMPAPNASLGVDSRERSSPLRGSRPSGVRLGSLSANSEEDLRFIQDRLGLFGKVTFLISSMFLVATVMADAFASVKRFGAAAFASHVIGTLLVLGIWRIARGRMMLSPPALQRLDVVGTLGICWAFAAMGYDAVQPYGYFTSLLAMTHV